MIVWAYTVFVIAVGLLFYFILAIATFIVFYLLLKGDDKNKPNLPDTSMPRHAQKPNTGKNFNDTDNIKN
jgi:hypothetical protein